MASEIRHILFQPPEVVHAVGEYLRRVGRPVPRGEVLRSRVDGGSGNTPLRITITIGTTTPSPVFGVKPEEERVVIEGADLTAALILACRAKRIPLPSRATKSLQLFGEQVALVFKMAAGATDQGQSDKLAF
jgi:hypothetical protein